MNENGHRENVRIEALAGRSAGRGKDVLIRAPAAHAFGPYNVAQPLGIEITPENVIHWQNEELRQLRNQLQELRMTASTIANIAICYARMREDDGLSLEIPRPVSDRMIGANITMWETPEGNIGVRLRERGEFPVDIEP